MTEINKEASDCWFLSAVSPQTGKISDTQKNLEAILLNLLFGCLQ
jgi:hypothetical protein